MATFGADLYIWLVRYHPTSFPFIFFSTFNLGVAMVAMVAMPREYTENGSRQMKLPDARSVWRGVPIRPIVYVQVQL